MNKFSTFTQYQKSEKSGLKSRIIIALKAQSMGGLFAVANDLAKRRFARFLVLDCLGTKKLCWSMAEAEAWIPFCSANMRIVDTLDFAVVLERKQVRAY